MYTYLHLHNAYVLYCIVLLMHAYHTCRICTCTLLMHMCTHRFLCALTAFLLRLRCFTLSFYFTLFSAAFCSPSLPIAGLRAGTFVTSYPKLQSARIPRKDPGNHSVVFSVLRSSAVCLLPVF